MKDSNLHCRIQRPLSSPLDESRMVKVESIELSNLPSKNRVLFQSSFTSKKKLQW